jgi:Zn-dependent protease
MYTKATRMESTQIALIVALIISVIIHEMAHGYAANYLGDPTARLQGRLSPNPLVHIDPMMSVILPALLIFSGSSFVFGAAKPVPYNPYNFRNQKWGEAFVAAAGPLSNICLAVIFAGLIRFSDVLNLSETFVYLAFQIVALNIFLAVFNLVPLPPLDGSKIFPKLLPFSLQMKYEQFRNFMEQNVALAFGLVIVVFVLFLGGPLSDLTRTISFWLVS